MLLHTAQSIEKQTFLVKYDYTKSIVIHSAYLLLLVSWIFYHHTAAKLERNNRLCMELHVHLDKKSIVSSDLFQILQETNTTCIKNDEKIPRYSVVNMSAF